MQRLERGAGAGLHARRSSLCSPRMNFRDLSPAKRKAMAKKGRAALGDRAHRFTTDEARAGGKKRSQTMTAAERAKGAHSPKTKRKKP